MSPLLACRAGAAKQQAHDLRRKDTLVQQPLGLAQALQVERVHAPFVGFDHREKVVVQPARIRNRKLL